MDPQRSEERRRKNAAGWFRRLPFALRVVLPAALVILAGWQAWEWWKARFARITIVLPEGATMPQEPAGLGVRLEFFPYSDSGAAISPPPELGELPWEGGVVWAGPDLVPGQGLLRVSAPGFGTGYEWLEPGSHVTTVHLAPPRRMSGRVVDHDEQPLAGARVFGFGGRERGVPLAEATSAADGTFVLEGFAPPDLLLRVLQPGFAVQEASWTAGSEPPTLVLQPTKTVHGRIVVPAELQAEGFTTGGQYVQAFRVPGVHTKTADDGTFVLDHLPPPPGIVRLVLPQLPEGWTHRATVVEPGQQDVVLVVHRAGVVTGQLTWENGTPAAEAAVLHEHGPTGNVSGTVDASGRFRIERVPPGEVVLQAVFVPKPRRLGPPVISTQGPTDQVRSGSAVVVMREGETREDVRIVLQ